MYSSPTSCLWIPHRPPAYIYLIPISCLCTVCIPRRPPAYVSPTNLPATCASPRPTSALGGEIRTVAEVGLQCGVSKVLGYTKFHLAFPGVEGAYHARLPPQTWASLHFFSRLELCLIPYQVWTVLRVFDIYFLALHLISSFIAVYCITDDVCSVWQYWLRKSASVRVCVRVWVKIL